MDVLDAYDVLSSTKIDAGTKSRVAVFGHPSDRSTMEAVAADLHPLLFCDVYLPHDDSALPEPEDLRLFLAQMDLVVFVVSKDFLHEDNPARVSVFPMAVQEGIRMLMLKVGDGVGREFSRICGRYHLLDRSSDNYQQELSAFIDEQVSPHHIIIADSDLPVYEGLFKKRGFISYRKRDRAKLLALLDRVREIPQLLDVALWFDDALVPGENYTEQIMGQLSKADFVILVATPSVLEEGNYVVAHEYPQAVSEGKPIVAIDMADVDEDEFIARFSQLAAHVRGDDGDALAQALLEVTSTSEEHRLLPYQLYFAARDYSLGVRTERNQRLALRLYTEAAEAGDPWAMAQLAEDNFAGIVMPRNEDAARMWLDQAVPALHALMRSTPAHDDGAYGIGATLSKLSMMLAEICIAQGEEGQAADALSIQEEAVEYLRRAGVQSGLHNAGAPYLVRGSACVSRGDYAEGIAWFDKAEDTILAFEQHGGFYGLLNSAYLYARRGHAHTRLLVQDAANDGMSYHMEHLEPAGRDLERALPRLIRVREADSSKDLDGIILEVARDMVLVGAAYELVVDGTRTARELYRAALDALVGLRGVSDGGKVDDRELAHQCAMAQYYLATAGRIVPDYAMLRESHELFVALGRDDESGQYDIPIASTRKALLLDAVRHNLDRRTSWQHVIATRDQLVRAFTYPDGIVPEGELGMVSGSFRMSAYQCPRCRTTLYKTVFPEGHDLELTVDGDYRRIRCSRIFACPHGHYFVAPRGSRIVDGPVYMAAYEPDQDCLQDVGEAWWWYLSQIGDPYAQRDD